MARTKARAAATGGGRGHGVERRPRANTLCRSLAERGPAGRRIAVKRAKTTVLIASCFVTPICETRGSPLGVVESNSPLSVLFYYLFDYCSPIALLLLD